MLIESVEASGASARDVRARAKTLQHAGCEVRAAVVEPLHVDRLDPAAPLPGDSLVVHAEPRGRRRLREWMSEWPSDLVLVASAVEGGGEAGRWVSRFPGIEAWWWPSGVAGRAKPALLGNARASEASMGSMLRRGPLIPLPIAGALVGGEPWPGACAGLGASVLADARLRRSQLPLWDGDYLLSLTPLAGAAGRTAIDAFAGICESHDGLDLVVLADPQPEFERYARTRGVGFRVHFAGEARPDAELAWLSGAGAGLIAGDAPVSGGLVLRALERGCPLLAAPGAATAAPLETWLSAHGLAAGRADEPLARRLESTLERRAAWREAGPRVAERHALAAIAGRVAASLDAADGRQAA